MGADSMVMDGGLATVVVMPISTLRSCTRWWIEILKGKPVNEVL